MRPECHMTFDVKATDGLARRGQITFPRGTIQTPAFCPNVVCVGGSWIAPADLLAAGDYSEIEERARHATSLV